MTHVNLKSHEREEIGNEWHCSTAGAHQGSCQQLFMLTKVGSNEYVTTATPAC